MASNSEVTFGARLNNAQTLQTHVQSFTNYTSSSPELMPAALQALVDEARNHNTDVASNTQLYGTVVNTRKQLFQNGPGSLIKTLSPIGSEVRSAFGKTSKEAAYIKGMVDKIRGVKVSKAKKQPDEEFVSQSERSYGSMTQNFSNIITTLQNYGAKYSPSNKSIQLPALLTFLTSLSQANTDVTTAFGKFKVATGKRADTFKTLTDTCQRAKDAVKSQYLVSSTEYALVKGLKI